MSKTKKKVNAVDHVREREAPTHRQRREIHQKVDKFVGPLDDDLLEEDDEEEFEQFQPMRKKHV